MHDGILCMHDGKLCMHDGMLDPKNAIDTLEMLCTLNSTQFTPHTQAAVLNQIAVTLLHVTYIIVNEKLPEYQQFLPINGCVM